MSTPPEKIITTQEDMLKKQNMFVTVLFLVVVGIAIFFFFRMFGNYTELKKRTSELKMLTTYDLSPITNNTTIQAKAMGWKSLDDIVDTNEELMEEKKRYEEYQTVLNSTYENFLKNIYLPPLNIWKNIYTDKIDENLVGKKFLKENPYTDLALITKRSNFFKDVGDQSQFNEITNISISAVEEDDTTGIFRIPISLSFSSPNRRSFLLLVEKLSMTSSKENISLINELMYHFREEVKKTKGESIYGMFTGAEREGISHDKKIGYALYLRINNGEESGFNTTFMTETVLEETIKKAAGCKQIGDECYFLFREKFRSLPYLAYTLADKGIDKVAALKKFLTNLPPLIKIKEFTFDKSNRVNLFDQREQFQGKMSIEIYGKAIPESDVTQVGAILGTKCFTDKHPLSVGDAIMQVQNDITELGNIDSINAKKAKELQELAIILQNIGNEYAQMTNYNKIVKIFESYRMLQDAGICDL